MANLISSAILIMLSAFALTTVAANAMHEHDEAAWLRNICVGNNYKATKLHFYIQDALGGPNATVWEVSRSTITGQSSTSFGQIRVLDDKITATPDPSSKQLGRAQGLITCSDFSISALNMNLNIEFTSGKYNGSTLSILGRNQIMNKDRELPVVGGTGAFRMARGYAISNTYSYDVEKEYGVLEYTIYVAYPKLPSRIQMVAR